MFLFTYQNLLHFGTIKVIKKHKNIISPSSMAFYMFQTTITKMLAKKRIVFLKVTYSRCSTKQQK